MITSLRQFCTFQGSRHVLMKRFIQVILLFCILHPVHTLSQEVRFPIEMDNGQTFYPGRYAIKDKPEQPGYLHFDRVHQLLLVMKENELYKLNASEVESFSYQFQFGTPYAEEVRYITWKHRREWPSYAQMGFFRILADYTRCAIVTSDQKPEIMDQYPDSAEVFSAKIAQGISYHIILPDGSLVTYSRDTIDEYLQIILGNDYPDVMLYAHRHGLHPTRFVDLFTILDYAETLRVP